MTQIISVLRFLGIEHKKMLSKSTDFLTDNGTVSYGQISRALQQEYQLKDIIQTFNKVIGMLQKFQELQKDFIKDNDTRLYDKRAPLEHYHAINDIKGIDTNQNNSEVDLRFSLNEYTRT